VRDDLERLRQHRNEPATRRWLEDDRVVDRDQQARWFERLDSTKIYMIAGNDELGDIGLIRITHESAHKRALCVGCDVFSAFRGKGLGHEVFAAACKVALTMHPDELFLWVFASNLAGVLIYRKAGFTFCPREPVRWFWRGGKPEPYVKMVCSPADWRSPS
jgi:RimJ/RimL family protein N-acetyltransferase